MTPNEFEEQLNELETRVDRLRALYENWFRGYEKTEPRVARKDVERRVYTMRKDLPRNTALRFRYHQLYQRYTTLTSYWSRTAKQIEEGTYRLQLQRFRRKKERGEEHAASEHDRPERSEDEKERPGAYELDLDESLNVDDLLSDFEKEAVAKVVDGSIHPPAPARATFQNKKPVAIDAPPSAGVVAKPGQGERPGKREAFWDDEFESPTGLHLDMQEEPRPRAPQPRASQPEAPKAVPAPAMNGAARAAPPGVPAVPPPAAPRPAAPPLPPSMPRPSQPEARPNGAGTGRMPSPFGAPPQPIKPAPVATVGAPARPADSAQGLPPQVSRAPIQSVNTLVGRPQPKSPIAGPAPKSAPEAPPADQNLRRIYNEYAEARRRNNEGEVRYEALVSSIQKMMPDLEKKHAGKKIDFEVVVKDGRVGLKPKPTDTK